MKILITGATGKVGSRLTKRLAARHQVRALVRELERARSLLGDDVELSQGDLLEPTSLALAVRGVDAVVHCAAFFRGASEQQAHAVNDLGTRQLAAATARATRFLFISTGLVYGPKAGRVVSEEDTCEPTLAYPLSKLAAEKFLLASEHLDVRVLRLPFVYGDGDPHIEEVVPMMRGFPAAQHMSVAHHVDVAQAVALLLEAGSLRHRIYDLVDDEAPTLREVFASVGAPPPDGTHADLARAFDARASGQRLRSELGFEPTYPRLADAVARGAHR